MIKVGLFQGMRANFTFFPIIGDLVSGGMSRSYSFEGRRRIAKTKVEAMTQSYMKLWPVKVNKSFR